MGDFFAGHARIQNAGENVTSPGSGAMTGAERVRLHRQRKAAALKYTSDEWRAFVNSDSLQRKAGASWRSMPAMVLKELADNAADAADGRGASIEPVTIGDTPWWRIADQGDGIEPNEVARVFAVNRPMVSTKHIRLPRRGMLGNGTRVVAGYCAVTGSGLIVDSMSTRTVLRLEKATGRTVIVRQEPIEPETGTSVYLPRLGLLAEDGVDNLAQNTMVLADPAPDARQYQGPSNPWWYGPADLLRLLVTAPAGASIGEVVRDMGLALPRGVPDGLAAEATEERAGLLLAALRERYAPVGVAKIGRVGRDAFGYEYPGYAIRTLNAGFHSGAEIPVVIEVFARCDGWKRRDLSASAIVSTYLNRSAVLVGVAVSGALNSVRVHGAGIGLETIAAKPGRYQAIVSIITPHARLLSDGKAPDFGYLGKIISELLGKALGLARRGVPPDDETPEERNRREAEAEEARREKEDQAGRRERKRRQREADLAAWRSIKGPRVLLKTIEAEAEAAGLWVDDLLVGDRRHDPYFADSASNHRIGRWLAEHMPKGRTIHLRGLHYLLVSTTALIRPDGAPYRNDLKTWHWLQTALNAARWLGYVGFDQIEDERNAAPVMVSVSDAASAPVMRISEPGLTGLPDVADLSPRLSLAWDGAADRQRFQVYLVGEKTGLRQILAPLAEEYSAGLLLDSGEPSITHMHWLVENAITDGRPLVLLTFTDCDPTGWGIPASIGRKLQAMLAMAGSDLHVRVIRAALTVEQARELDLPSMPLKDTEARADRWQATTGRGQTEIDALLALQPDVLEQIARDAIKPFFDEGLARRAREARVAWEKEARAILGAALDQMPEHCKALKLLRRRHAGYGKWHAAIAATVGEVRATMQRAIDRADMPTLPTLPEWQTPDLRVPDPLFDSADGFVVNTRRLQQAKLRDAGGRPAPDDDADDYVPRWAEPDDDED